MIRVLRLSIISLVLLVLLIGCADREEDTTAIGSTPKADAALKEAEKNLKDVGVIISFKDPGELAHPQNLVPKPEDIASQEKQKKIADAIIQLNIVISEIEQEAKMAPPIGSVSDRGIVHFYLGLAYLLDAISRLLISDDPKTTFIIEYNPNASSGEWFTYGISNETKAKLDSIKNPLEYPNAFTEKERQAIIDALDLISDAIVKPKLTSIKPQSSTVNGPPYLHSAKWHFKKAIGLFSDYNAELRDALKDFDNQIDKLETVMKKNAESWGFSYTSSQEG